MANLPEKLTNDQKEAIRQQVNDYLKAKGLSRRKLATQIGISDALLTQLVNGNWESISDEMFRRVQNKVSEAAGPGLFKTADFTAATQVCESARQHRFMIGLTGDTGTGKTTALNAFAMRKNVFYVVYDKIMKPRQFFAVLLREMGISYEGNIYDMVNRIADELNTMDSPLVIIDEAGKITHTMILYLHVLRDKTLKNCGIVLGGMPYFKSNLIKYSDKQKEGYAEFYRRINLWQTLDGLTTTEINFICQQHGITDAETLRDMKSKKRFGDLYNAILLHNIENQEP